MGNEEYFLLSHIHSWLPTKNTTKNAVRQPNLIIPSIMHLMFLPLEVYLLEAYLFGLFHLNHTLIIVEKYIKVVIEKLVDKEIYIIV